MPNRRLHERVARRGSPPFAPQRKLGFTARVRGPVPVPGPRTVPPVMMPIVPRAFLAAVPVIGRKRDERSRVGDEDGLTFGFGFFLFFLVFRR